MWAVLLEIFKAAGPWVGLGIIVVGALCLTIRLLWKELTKERETNIANYKALLESQDKAHTNVVHQLFDVVNRNTESHVRSTEAVKELKDSMRDLRMSIASQKHI